MPDRPARIALYGRDFGAYGALHVDALPRAAAAISAGADPRSPSTRFKGDPERPNEDALLVLDDGRRCLLAVADSHFGHRASHALIERLAALDAVPPDARALAAWLDAGPAWPASVDDRSASTLCAVVYDRSSGAGEGLSIGDSRVVLIGPDGAPAAQNPRTAAYVHPGRDARPARRARPFAFTAAPGGLLLAFTDGVDECHYRRPETSIRPAHLAALFAETGPDPRRYAERLARLALAGVDGHPGGEDNLALAAAAT